MLLDYSSEIAPVGQTLAQAPQLMHASALISWKKSKNPLLTQARKPFTFQEINFIVSLLFIDTYR